MFATTGIIATASVLANDLALLFDRKNEPAVISNSVIQVREEATGNIHVGSGNTKSTNQREPPVVRVGSARARL